MEVGQRQRLETAEGSKKRVRDENGNGNGNGSEKRDTASGTRGAKAWTVDDG